MQKDNILQPAAFTPSISTPNNNTPIDSHNTSFQKNTDLKTSGPTVGRHYIIDFWGAKDLDNEKAIKSAMTSAAEKAKATLLHIHLHRFNNGGITGVALLAESHISIHTWPEYEYAAFDVFMCGASKPEKAIQTLKNCFSPKTFQIQEIRRGQMINPINQQQKNTTHENP